MPSNRQPRQKSNVVRLPFKKIAFDAVSLDGEKITTKYDSNRLYLKVCQAFLECSPKQMRAKLGAIEARDDVGDDVG